MNSSELVDRIDELRFGMTNPGVNKELKVKFRVQVGNRVVVLDLEPEMLQVKDWGSEESAILLLDLV